MNDPLDRNILSELKEIMAEDFTVLVDTYLSDSSKQLGRLQETWQNGDIESLRRVAHSLKGSCNVGARHLAYLCSQLEQRVVEEQLVGIEELLDQVAREYQSVATSIRTF